MTLEEQAEATERRFVVELELGTPFVFGADAPGSPYGVVFKDDGQTGYLYALDRRRPKRSLDELHAYTVPTGQRPRCRLEIAWNDGGSKVALLIDGLVVAVFAFALNMAFSRSGLPAAASGFAASHTWNDEAFRSHWRYLEERVLLDVDVHRVEAVAQEGAVADAAAAVQLQR